LYTATALINIGTYGVSVWDSPATTSATMYKTRIYEPEQHQHKFVVQTGTAASTITLLERFGVIP
jgi:hypothetical protein